MTPRASPAPVGASTSRSIDPLSPDRYKLQLTVTTDVKQKLDLARDLLRHAVPSGDLATLIERALDLLIEQTTQRRFAKRKVHACPPSKPASTSAPVPLTPWVAATPAAATPALTGAEPNAPALTVNEPACEPATPAPPMDSRHIPHEARRAVPRARRPALHLARPRRHPLQQPRLARARSHRPARQRRPPRSAQRPHPVSCPQPPRRRARLRPRHHHPHHHQPPQPPLPAQQQPRSMK